MSSQRALNGLYGFDIEAIKDQGESIRKALAEMTVGPTDLAALEPDEGPMIVTNEALIAIGARQKPRE